MARRGGSKELFLTVGADVSPLQTASKSAKSALATIGEAAGDVQAEVRKSFDEMGRSGIKDALLDTEKAAGKTFDRIRDNMRKALAAPDGVTAVSIINAAEAEQGARAAEMQAQELRKVADFAGQAARESGQASAATRVLAASFEANALQAENEAKAFRDQANALNTLEAGMRGVSVESLQHMQVGGKVAVSAGQQRAAMQQLGFQVNDVATQFASGTPPMQIFAQQGGQVIQAVQMMSNETKGFLGFLGGPWGAGIALATVVLAPMVIELIKGNDALDDGVDKLKKDAKETEVNRQAKEAYGKTVEGITEAIKAQNEELRKSIQTQQDAADQANINAKQGLESLQIKRAQIAAELEYAKAYLATQRTRASGPGQQAEVAALGLGRAQDRVSALQTALSGIDASVTIATEGVNRSRAALADLGAQRAVDPIKRINDQYDQMKSAAIEAAVATGRVTSALTEQLAAIEIKRRAELKTQQDRQSASRSTRNENRQSGRQIDVSGARAIVGSIGGTVTSGFRTPEQQKRLYADYIAGRGPLAAKPGTSMHEHGQAVDIAKSNGMSLGKIVEAFAARGVNLTEKLDEGRHFHVAWGAKGPKAKSAETLAKQEQARVAGEANDRRAFEQQLSAAQTRVARAMMGQADTTENRLAIAIEDLRSSQEQANLAIDDQVIAGKITKAQGDRLKSLGADAEFLGEIAAQSKAQQETLDRQLSIDRDAIDAKIEELQLQADLATTTEQRRRIALQILALDEKAAREAAKRDTESDDPDRQRHGRDALARIDATSGMRQAKVEGQYAGPLEQYRAHLVDSVGDMDRAMEGVKAHGLQNLEDGLTGLVSGTETVAGAFKKMASSIVADLARIAIQKLILNAIGGGGGFFGFKTGGKVAGYAEGGLPGFAGGASSRVNGLIRGPGNGTSDSILALVGGTNPIMVSNGESIVTEAATKRYWPLIKAMNDGALPAFAGGGAIDAASLSYPAIPSARALASAGGRSDGELRVRVMLDESLDARIDNRAAGVAVEVVRGAAPALIDGAKNATIADLRRPRL